jgi:hypothetical protein
MRTANVNAQAQVKVKHVKHVKTKKEKRDEALELLHINPSEIFLEDEEFYPESFIADNYGCNNQFIQQQISRCYLG